MPRSVTEGFVNFNLGFSQWNVVFVLRSQSDTFEASFNEVIIFKNHIQAVLGKHTVNGGFK